MSSPIDHTPTDTAQPNQLTLVPMSEAVGGGLLSRVEAEQVTELIEKAVSQNTRTAYASDLRQIARWVQTAKPELAAHIVGKDTQDRPTIIGQVPVAVVLAYIAARQHELAAPSICRHLASLATFHALHGWPKPTSDAYVRAATKGLRNDQQHEPKRAHPLRATQLRHIVRELASDMAAGDKAAVRDRALLLVGWHGALRRSELANLTWQQVQKSGNGIVLRLRGTKTDKAGEGQTVAIPEHLAAMYDAQKALMDWLTVCDAIGWPSDWEQLPVFCEVPTDNVPRVGRKLSGKAVGEIVKRRAARAGLDAYPMSGHSLRAGLITEAHAQGVSDLDIMHTSRHKTHKVFASYVRDAEAMSRAASKGLL